MADHLVVHGHFYQPPRHNPWTEAVPVEPSAAPAHDWNERIDAESYRPNAFARIVDGEGRVEAIVNNYALMSFNVGPTLDRWLALHAPETLARMVAGDQLGGGAIAQPFHHVILPLANDRDRRTEIRWGLAAFADRFGRPAEGIWLPETAVNEEVLAVLVEEGVRYTILAPYQAAERASHGAAYRWTHPDGAGEMTLVFYDGSLSHDVAFGAALTSASALVDRSLGVTSPDGLVVIATDGETFGHHHKFTERAIAYALAVEAPGRGLAVGGLAAWLDGHPPAQAMRVVESAWSCAHGVGRWRTDCGCSTGGSPGATQTWRGPLRDALDLLRDAAARVFEGRGGAVFHDPWAARDAYVRVLLDPRSRDDFLAEHARPDADPVEALTLLEIQRESLAMYTSCGWFFWDLAGLETVQVMRHAARCMDLLDEIGAEAPRAAVLATLAATRSNTRGEGDGAEVWATYVDSVRLDAAAIVDRAALLVVEPARLSVIAPAWEVVESPERTARAGSSLFAGRLAVRDRRTGRVHAAAVRVLADGRAVLAGWIGDGRSPDVDADVQARAEFVAGRPFAELQPQSDAWRAIDVLAALPGETGHPDRVQQALDGGWWSGLLEAAAADSSVLDACAPSLVEILATAAREQRALPLERLQELLVERLAAGPVGPDLLAAATSAKLSPATRPVV